MDRVLTHFLAFASIALLMAGCGSVKQAPSAEAVKSAPETQAAAPSAPRPGTAPPPSAAPPSPSIAIAPPAAQPAERPAGPPSTAPGDTAAKATPPATKAPAKAAPPAAPAAKREAAPPAEAKQQAAAPLDLNSLETRLKNTQAIGVLTKLTLKNQVDDLLNQFRAFYQGKLKTTLADLRRPYDLLILKVLSLLQDKDPSLAADLASSREAIWGILSDPVKFAQI